MPEMIFIFLLALVVVGPKRLPELARQLGKLYADFKRVSNDFKSQLETEMMNMELEERAKKVEPHIEVSPPPNPWEPMILPPEGRVSRESSEAIPQLAGVSGDSLVAIGQAAEEKDLPVRSASPDA